MVQQRPGVISNLNPKNATSKARSGPLRRWSRCFTLKTPYGDLKNEPGERSKSDVNQIPGRATPSDPKNRSMAKVSSTSQGVMVQFRVPSHDNPLGAPSTLSASRCTCDSEHGRFTPKIYESLISFEKGQSRVPTLRKMSGKRGFVGPSNEAEHSTSPEKRGRYFTPWRVHFASPDTVGNPMVNASACGIYNNTLASLNIVFALQNYITAPEQMEPLD
ncbi:hypothetical protein B0H11DRAFT_2194773 [Mycena galericulata]|nr:hypothetical protein B0H11DRAFT_2194773 [Mycena galericulata]